MKPFVRRFGATLRRLNHVMVAWLAQLFIGMVRLLPRERAFATAEWLARKIAPLFGRHRVAVNNLKQAYPEKSAAEVEKIASDMWGHMARLAVEYIYLDRLMHRPHGELLPPNLDLLGAEHFFRIIEQEGKPHIIFTAHIGNFELLPVVASMYGLKTTVMFRPPNNPYLADYVSRMRNATMEDLVPTRAGAALTLARVLEAGGNVGVLVDQKLIHGGVRTTFFGRPCDTSPLVPKLAREFDCPVYPARCVRLPNGHFELLIEPALTLPRDAKGEVDVTASTQMLNDVVERWVREHPEQWTWFHRRWTLSGYRHPARKPRGS